MTKKISYDLTSEHTKEFFEQLYFMSIWDLKTPI